MSNDLAVRTDNRHPIVVAIGKMAPEFEKALANTGISPDKFIRVAQTAVQMEPKLLAEDINRASLFAAMIRCAQDGLLPDKREAALVPFKGEVQYMPMIGGILKKIRNSGEVVDLGARVVREGDEFDAWTDDQGEHVNHRPLPFSNAKVIGVYARARTKDGGTYVQTMSVEEVEKVRNVSRAKDAGPWLIWWDEKACVAVMRRLSKRLPMSSDIEQFMRETVDKEFDFDQRPGDEPAAGTPAPAGPKPNRPTRLQGVADRAPQKPAAAADEPGDSPPPPGSDDDVEV